MKDTPQTRLRYIIQEQKVVMIKKLISHILFFVLLLALYIFFSKIYSRETEENISMIYGILSATVFCINLIKRRTIKCLIILLISFINLSVLIGGSIGIADSLFDEMFINGMEMTMPFLPKFFMLDNITCIGNCAIRKTALYLFYYGETVLYWYLLYWLSKKIYDFIHKFIKKIIKS